jgi:hypothetical protein
MASVDNRGTAPCGRGSEINLRAVKITLDLRGDVEAGRSYVTGLVLTHQSLGVALDLVF